MKPIILKQFVKTEERFDGWLCWNVVIGDFETADLELFFGPFEGQTTVFNLDCLDWPNLLKTLEIFPSASQARKNGWDKPIDIGWSEARFKKARIVVFVLRLSSNK